MEVMLSLTDKVPTVEVYVKKLDIDYGTVSQSHYAHATFTRMLDSDVDPSFIQCTPGFETVAPTGGSQFLHGQW